MVFLAHSLQFLIYCNSILSLVFVVVMLVFVRAIECGKLFCGGMWEIVGESVYFYIIISVDVY